MWGQTPRSPVSVRKQGNEGSDPIFMQPNCSKLSVSGACSTMRTCRSDPPYRSTRRSVREQMVHQYMSEDGCFKNMLGIDVGAPPLPVSETRMEFIRRYAEDAGRRLEALRSKSDA